MLVIGLYSVGKKDWGKIDEKIPENYDVGELQTWRLKGAEKRSTKFEYSQTCVQRPPLGPQNSGRC